MVAEGNSPLPPPKDPYTPFRTVWISQIDLFKYNQSSESKKAIYILWPEITSTIYLVPQPELAAGLPISVNTSLCL